MRGRKNHKKPATTNILPPCRVCGEQGTGFHYGVTTCGACKGFFRRSLTRDEPYECVRSQSCLVGPCIDRRHTCPKCRLDKCIAVGMCKEACKVGRYSLDKKHKYIEEVTEQHRASHQLGPPVFMDAHGNNMWSQCYPPTAPGTTLFPTIHFNVSANQRFPNVTGDNSFFVPQTTPDPTVGMQLSMNGQVSNSASKTIRIINHNPVSHHENAGLSYPEFSQDHANNTTFPMTHLGCGANVVNSMTGALDSTINSLAKMPQHTGANSNVPFYTVLEPSNSTHNPHQSLHFSNEIPDPFEITPQQTCAPVISNGTSSYPSLMTTSADTSSANLSNHMITSELVSNSLEIISDTSANQIIPRNNECDPKSEIVMACGNGTRFAGMKNNEPVCRIAKRLLNGTEEDNESIPRKQVPKIVEPDSSLPSTLEIAKTPASISKDNNDDQSKPLVLCVVGPDPMKYVLSVFEKFPFKSFERESLAPLLRLCYNVSDWVNDYLPQTTTPHVKTPNTKSPPYKRRVPPIIKLNSNDSSEVPSSACEITYDPEEMATLLDHIKATHCCYWGPESDFLTISDKQMYLQMFQKICQLQGSLQGQLNLIDDEKYFSVLQATGVDVDKRKAWFSCTFSGFDESFTKDSKFFLALPGFRNFHVKDRIALTKATAMTHSGLKMAQSVDFDKDLCIDEDRGIATRISTVLRLIPGYGSVYEDWSCLLRVLKELDISFDEFIVLKALVIMLPDFCPDLQDARLVTQWHNVYLKCLLYLVRKTHGSDGDERFNKFLGALEKLKDMHDTMSSVRHASKEVFVHLNDEEKQPLFHEVCVNLPSLQVN